MNKDNKIIDILKELEKETEIPAKEIESIIDNMYDFIYDTISDIDMQDLSIQEFDATKKNFMIGGLMKLYADRKLFNFIKYKNNERE